MKKLCFVLALLAYVLFAETYAGQADASEISAGQVITVYDKNGVKYTIYNQTQYEFTNLLLDTANGFACLYLSTGDFVYQRTVKSSGVGYIYCRVMRGYVAGFLLVNTKNDEIIITDNDVSGPADVTFNTDKSTYDILASTSNLYDLDTGNLLLSKVGTVSFPAPLSPLGQALRQSPSPLREVMGVIPVMIILLVGLVGFWKALKMLLNLLRMG